MAGSRAGGRLANLRPGTPRPHASSTRLLRRCTEWATPTRGGPAEPEPGTAPYLSLEHETGGPNLSWGSPGEALPRRRAPLYLQHAPLPLSTDGDPNLSRGSLSEARFLCAGAQAGSWTHLDQPWQWQERPSDPRRSEVMTPGLMQLLPPPLPTCGGWRGHGPAGRHFGHQRRGAEPAEYRAALVLCVLCPLSVFALTTGSGTYRVLRVSFLRQLEWGGWGSPGDASAWQRTPPYLAAHASHAGVRTGRPQLGLGVARLNPNLAARPT